MRKALLLAITLSFLAVPAASAQASAISASAVASLINTERQSNGLSGLRENALLARAAQVKAEDMLLRGYFAHEAPGGTMFYHLMDREGYKYSNSGENLAMNAGPVSLSVIIKSWMDSPSHRANILNSSYIETGIGIATGMYQGRETTFIVQIFGTPVAASKPVVAPAPAAVPVAVSVAQPVVQIARVVATKVVPKAEAKAVVFAKQESEFTTGAVLESVAALEPAPDGPRYVRAGWVARLRALLKNFFTFSYSRVG